MTDTALYRLRVGLNVILFISYSLNHELILSLSNILLRFSVRSDSDPRSVTWIIVSFSVLLSFSGFMEVY